MKKLFPILFLFTLWELLSIKHLIDNTIFPSPTLILSQMYRNLFWGSLSTDIGHSMYRLFLASIISIPIGYLLSLIVVHKKSINSFIEPIISFTYPLPKVAIYPFLIITLGIANKSKIALIAIGIFFPVFINTREGMKKLMHSNFHSVVKIYHPSNFNYFYNFIFKGSLHQLTIGIISGINYGLTLVVVSEMSLSNNGLGNFIWKSWEQFRSEDMFAGIFTLCIIGFLINSILNKLLMKTFKSF